MSGPDPRALFFRRPDWTAAPLASFLGKPLLLVFFRHLA
jgi:hypothetical protein